MRIMRQVTTGWFLLLMYAIVLHVAPVRVESATAFCKQVVEPLGAYDCEEFTVQTEDGYVLALHRLSRMHWPPSTSGDDNDTRSGKTLGKHETRKTMKRIPAQQAGATMAPPSNFEPILAPNCVRNSPIQAQAHSHLANGSGDEAGRLPAPSRNNSMTLNPLISAKSNSNSTSGQRSKAPSPHHSSPTQNETDSHESAPSRTTTRHGSSSNYTSNPQAGKNAPVLLMHQEFLNGDSWFQYVDSPHEGRLLPFMLLDDGFDVWIGHQRATYWGHGHVHLKSTDREFWNWTWDQHAEYDFPAQLRFISAEANQPVHVIGASQAATVGAAGATNQGTAQMIRSLTLIGPTAYRGNTNSIVLDAWAYYFGAQIDSNYYSMGYQNGAFNFTSEFPGAGNISGTGLTGIALGLLSGPNCCLGSEVIQIKGGWDGTTSFKNLLHWQQGIRTSRFARFDYGSAASNNATYGQPTAPTYNPAQIPRRMYVFVVAGGRDWTAPPAGIFTFMQMLEMPAILINLTNYAHYDLSYSLNRENDIYVPILRFLEDEDFF